MRALRAQAELLGIVVLRFPVPTRVWAVLLILVNAASLAFIDTRYGQVAFAAVVAAVATMTIIYLKRGFVRLLGVGHIFWIPMLGWFVLDLPDRAAQPALYGWVVALLACNAISLVIDAYQVIRFAAGDREPHYHWNQAVSARS